MPGKIRYMCFKKQAKKLHKIRLVVCTSSTSSVSFFRSLRYTTSPGGKIRAVKKSGNTLQRNESKNFNINRLFCKIFGTLKIKHYFRALR